jgi:ribonucleoside-diphosphate reductase subunit M1
MSIVHPDYSKLAARIAISNLHKMTLDSFGDVVEMLYFHKDKQGRVSPLVSRELYDVVMKYKEQIEARIVKDRDYNYDFFGFKTLEKAYLLRIYDKVVERPQYLLMRVSLGIHLDDLDSAFETYDLMS